MNNLTPEYLRVLIPPLQLHLYGYRSSNVLRPILCRTERYQNSFFPNSVNSWNGIGPELRGATSLSIFKTNILKIIRPEKKSMFSIHDSNGISWIFQLRVGLSPLKCHKKAHNFMDTPDDRCICLMEETTQHFLLKCLIYNEQRRKLFQTLNPILITKDLHLINDKDMNRLLLYGHESLSFSVNQIIINETIKFIRETHRFTKIE